MLNINRTKTNADSRQIIFGLIINSVCVQRWTASSIHSQYFDSIHLSLYCSVCGLKFMIVFAFASVFFISWKCRNEWKSTGTYVRAENKPNITTPIQYNPDQKLYHAFSCGLCMIRRTLFWGEFWSHYKCSIRISWCIFHCDYIHFICVSFFLFCCHPSYWWINCGIVFLYFIKMFACDQCDTTRILFVESARRIYGHPHLCANFSHYYNIISWRPMVVIFIQ